jgi:hypothetical protein
MRRRSGDILGQGESGEIRPSRKALFLLGFIAVGFHSLFVGVRVEVAAFVFLAAAAPAEIVSPHFGLVRLRNLASGEQSFEQLDHASDLSNGRRSGEKTIKKPQDPLSLAAVFPLYTILIIIRACVKLFAWLFAWQSVTSGPKARAGLGLAIELG